MTKEASINTLKAARQFRKDAAAYTAKAISSKKEAQKTLVKLGIYTNSGKLSKNYSK